MAMASLALTKCDEWFNCPACQNLLFSLISKSRINTQLESVVHVYTSQFCDQSVSTVWFFINNIMSMNRDQVKRLLTKFHQIDQSGDGVLSLDEVREITARSGLPPNQAEEFMRLFDLNGDNRVTLQEYISALGLDPPPPVDLKTWRNAFNSIDKDSSGYLSKQEVRQLLQQLNYNRCTDRQIEQWMKSVDKDGDGMISFAEFSTFMEMSTQPNPYN
ncbi:Calcium-binding protein [Fasciola hepatica]|uniref:Calcium-binding protein n=1 Tax=Fasciola hepatica TaxID=6192 RepID=A0A4E0RE94_FASHE|nr:Calcium-binding protein [Fasciola hepatica]